MCEGQLFKYINRINLLDKLIRQRRTVAPKEFTARVGLSRLARIVEYIRDMGALIKHNRTVQAYYYEAMYSIQTAYEG